ncbi:uncharacterized protein LOC113079928 [Carassius auratus]|uniref:Uncharacterized protein LOC113079928 n=1 Tax=Carassius auratus TaxID=7957 RepID=A0A6P6NIJ5_CARAU|nr:uncharacterized protein LOC113079928 [Carassius auratus]XP_026107946.1 uncharacterized protein LOC113079928 [Carassius auratus]
MAHSNDSPWTLEFPQDLLQSAERTLLLYHLCFLRLGKFPKLESLIRGQAVETHRLLRCSEAVIIKCVGTSSNLDSSLFPILKKVVEKNKHLLVLSYMGKIRTWIDDIIKPVDSVVKRYEQHIQSVAMCAIDVIQVQKIKEEKLGTLKIKSLEEEIAQLEERMRTHKNNWMTEIQLTELQKELGRYRMKQGVIFYLKEVQKFLSQIKQILVQLQKFWERVLSLLDTLKDKTLVVDNLTEDLDDLKEEFLTSIEAAREDWNNFGGSCRSAQGVFSIQSEDTYKFLEINTSSLSEDERRMLYESVMEKLNQISPQNSSTE